MKRYRILFILFLMISSNVVLSKAEFRNIAVYSNHSYSTERITEIYENTFIARINKNTSLLGNIYYDKRKDWNNTIFYFGPVINLSRYTYAEFIYGHGEDSDDKNSDYYRVEVTRELPQVLYGAGYKRGALKGFSYNILSPFIKYWISGSLTARTRLYFVSDSEKEFAYALLGETEYGFFDRTVINAGFTSGDRLFDAEYGKEGNKKFSSLFAGVKYKFSEKTYIKGIYEFLMQENDIEVHKNTFVFDVKF